MPRGRLAQLIEDLRDSRAVRHAALVEYRFARLAYASEALEMGRGSYGVPLIPTFPGDQMRVKVGAYVSIALDVVIGDGGNHRTDWVSTYPFRAMLGLPGAYQDGHPQSRGDVLIGNDVWIGRGVRIMSGVEIGDGAVVGGYSVVTRSVRPYAVVVGVPAREIRRRFTDEVVEALLEIGWWNWPEERIRAAVPELNGGAIEDFIECHHRGRK